MPCFLNQPDLASMQLCLVQLCDGIFHVSSSLKLCHTVCVGVYNYKICMVVLLSSNIHFNITHQICTHNAKKPRILKLFSVSTSHQLTKLFESSTQLKNVNNCWYDLNQTLLWAKQHKTFHKLNSHKNLYHYYY